MNDDARFEAWLDEYEAKEGHGKPSRFEVWQASRRAALEEAAVICETAPDYLRDSTFDGAARAIRALSQQPQ